MRNPFLCDATAARPLCRVLAHLYSTLAMAAIAGCATPAGPPSKASSPGAKVPSYEDIFVLRSERVERTYPSTWCTVERAGFAPLKLPSLVEDRFRLWSLEMRSSDGRVVNAQASLAGDLHACFGATDNPQVVNFYLEAQIGQIRLSGKGACTTVRADFPEQGLATAQCTVPLKDHSGTYIAGLLTTNSMSSKAVISAETDPRGYVQASIATIRLWRKH